jgi:hypothetical protein
MPIQTRGIIVTTLLLIVASVHLRAQESVAVTGLPPSAPATGPSLFTVNENFLAFYYAPTATNPGAGETPRLVLSYTHFDVWKYGTNFLNIEWLQATNNRAPPFGTPAAPCDQGGPENPPGSQRCAAYTEIYGFFRSTLGWNQIFDTKTFSVGTLTNIEFAFGADVNTDNTTLGSAKRSIQAGLQFDFSAPYKGFLNVAGYVYQEWQNDGFASTFPVQQNPNPSGKVEFDPTWAVEINYTQPLGFLPPSIPLTYRALLVMHGPKGCGEPCAPTGPGLLRTTEYLTQQTLHLDVGKMLWDQPKQYAVWVGYRWWMNKFGIDADQPGGHFIGTLERTWLVGTIVAF